MNRSSSSSIIAILGVSTLLTACLSSDGGDVVRGSKQAQTECAAPKFSVNASSEGASAVASASATEPADGGRACQLAERYVCTHRVFSPEAHEGKETSEVCTELDALGGKTCLSVESTRFNTSDAARLPDTDASALLPGGEYNNEEYACTPREAAAVDVPRLAGLSTSLKGALTLAMGKCLADVRK